MYRRFVLLGVALAALVGCEAAPRPLATTRASGQALGIAVLDAFERGDRAMLDALALTEREFADHVWPDLPAARPERNLPLSYVWGDLHQKSNASLSEALRQHGGKRYELRRVSFDGTTDYAHYVVHRDATFEVTDASGGELALRLCGSFLEKDGAWKVFSYAVSD